MNTTTERAVLPALAPPSFDDPIFLEAKRISGNIIHDDEREDVFEAIFNESEIVLPPRRESFTLLAPHLNRSKTMSGNILFLGGCRYLIQRKLWDTLRGGTARTGYELMDPIPGDGRTTFRLKPALDDDPTNPYTMVTIKIEGKPSQGSSSYVEQAALQVISARDPSALRHVEGPARIGADSTQVYTVVPFFRDGTLFEVCTRSEKGRLTETEAAAIFKQIIQALELLQEVELCHRNIGLDKIIFRGKQCMLTSFEWALRVPTINGVVHVIEPQPLCGPHSVQFCAPELLNNEPFDGYAVDLWSCGVILLTMLLGYDAIFSAPVVEDKTYYQICIKRDLTGYLERLKNPNSSSYVDLHITDDACDLLQNMLIADAKERLTLSQVLQHPWMKTSKNAD